MKIERLPSTFGEPVAKQFGITAIVNDSITINVGTIGWMRPLEQQSRIGDVFLSHSHVDHIALLPLFLDNVYQSGPDYQQFHACRATEDCLRKDVFDDRLWPYFVRLPEEESPFPNLLTLEPEKTIELSDLGITPVPIHHIVPTVSFLLSDNCAVVVFVSDSGPTKRIREIRRLTADVRIIACHLTPYFFAEIVSKLIALTGNRVEIGVPGQTYVL